MSEEEQPFRQLIIALEPWLGDIVIIGGWAHQLYRRHPSAQSVSYNPLMTLDTDIAVPCELPVRDEDIRKRLVDNGFVEEFLGDAHPPATHYHLRDASSAFYVEFLAPLTGSHYDRTGRSKATIDVSGVASQRLRYIDLLLIHPWSVDFEFDDFRTKVQIPNPNSFLAQKILIHDDRASDKRAKDILYIHDTIEIFGSRLEELRLLWLGNIATTLSRKAARTVAEAHESMFGRISDDIRQAAQIAKDRQISPEGIRQACEYGLAHIFER